MKVEYVNPFISSTIETFRNMLQLELKAGKPVMKTNPAPSFDVSGIIGLTGDAVGSIAISFPKITALKAVSRFMGMDIKIIGQDLIDAVGELANIIAGNAKKDLTNMNVSISLPNVVVGKDLQISSPKEAQNIAIPFSSEVGDFMLEISLKTK